MDRYFVRVTRAGIIFPRDVSIGEYELVPVKKEDCDLNRVKVEEPSKYYDVFFEDGTKDYTATRMIHPLRCVGIQYLNEFEGMDIDEVIKHTKSIGFKVAVAIIAFCIKYDIGVVYSEEKYGVAVHDYLKRIKKKE